MLHHEVDVPVVVEGESREMVGLFTPRNPTQIACELCRWFGSRVVDNDSSSDHLDDSFADLTR